MVATPRRTAAALAVASALAMPPCALHAAQMLHNPCPTITLILDAWPYNLPGSA